MWRLVDRKVLTATAAVAKKFAEMKPCPHDRPLQQSRLALVTEVLKAGTFRAAEWATVYCKETGENYRVNGKHTSTARAALNGECQDLCILHTHHEADTLEDVAALYATFDTRSSVRSGPDIYMAFAASNLTLAALPRSIICLAATGMAYAKWEHENAKHTVLERAQLLTDNAPFVVALHEILSGGEGKCPHMRRSAVAAAIFRTNKVAQGDTKQFWGFVRDENHDSHRHPSRVLARYLNRVSVNVGAGAVKKGKSLVGVREVYVKCLHAWNAFRKGETTELKYYPAAKTPAVV